MLARRFLGLACLSLLATGALAAEGENTPAQQAAEAAIRKTIASYLAAYSRGDAKAIAAHWDAEAVYTDPETGESVQGRKAIEALFAARFAGKQQPQLTVAVKSIRLISPDVAMEEGVASVNTGDAVNDSTYVAIHVRRDNGWLLDSVRETALPTPPTGKEQLQSLAWMIGSWRDGVPGKEAVTDCQWAPNETFLKRTFKAPNGLSGTQFIGWDATSQAIRSWAFDSDGGVTEGLWTNAGERWTIRSIATLADGSQASSINILERLGDDEFSWQATGREVDGELLPNTPKITVKRIEK